MILDFYFILFVIQKVLFESHEYVIRGAVSHLLLILYGHQPIDLRYLSSLILILLNLVQVQITRLRRRNKFGNCAFALGAVLPRRHRLR